LSHNVRFGVGYCRVLRPARRALSQLHLAIEALDGLPDDEAENDGLDRPHVMA
jgi:hypothetical protein